MGSSKKSKEDPKSNGQRKRNRDGSMSSGSKKKRPCPKEVHGEMKKSGDGSKSSRPKNKRPCPEEEHGERSEDGSKSSGPKIKRLCPEEAHGKKTMKEAKKRKREDSSCGSVKRPKTSGSKAKEEEELRPGPSNVPQSCPRDENRIAIDRFKFGRMIGQGTYGKVFLASDNITKKMLAIKIVTKGLSAKAEQHLQLEKKLLQLTSGSPFLVNSCITFQTKKHWCFAMTYASGGDLRSHLTKHERLLISSAIFYAAEITSGLQFLHTMGFIHRDIKPSNILIDGSGHLKIADFGLAINKMDGVNRNAGTPGYMAPEIIAGKKYNAAVDWYSFGIVLYQLITGAKSCNCKVSELSGHHLDTDTENIIEELLCEDPSRRLGINGCIRQHPFFQQIDWADLEALKLPPPFIPGNSSEKKPELQAPQE